MSRPNINTPDYWDGVYRDEVARGAKQRVDAVRFSQLERWVRIREEELERPAYVLDFGCGLGDALFGLWTLRRDRKLLGIDHSSAAIEAARHEAYSLGAHDVQFRAGTEAEVYGPLRDEAVGMSVRPDVIWCGETLEHVDSAHSLVGGFTSILSKDGLLILSTPFKGRNRSDEHVREFGPSEVLAWVGSGMELLFFDTCLLPSWLTMFAVIRNGKRS